MPVRFLDPTQGPVPASASMAPRPRTLAGMFIALLDNGKANSDRLLDCIARVLAERYPGLTFERWRKPTHAKPAPADILDEIVRRKGAVITGVGD